MRRPVIASLILAAGGASASAGVVTFDPGGPAEVPQGGTLDMLVTVSSTDFAEFNSVGLLIASLDLDVLDFAYEPDFGMDVIKFHDNKPPPFDPPRYPDASELFVGGIAFLSDTWAAPVNVGTVTVRADVGLALGPYEVFVSSARDGGVSGLTSMSSGTPEGLEGSIMVQVIPEPATLALLGLGALGLARRRDSHTDPANRLRRQSEARQSWSGRAARSGQDRSLTLAVPIGG